MHAPAFLCSTCGLDISCASVSYFTVVLSFPQTCRAERCCMLCVYMFSKEVSCCFPLSSFVTARYSLPLATTDRAAKPARGSQTRGEFVARTWGIPTRIVEDVTRFLAFAKSFLDYAFKNMFP